MSIQDPIKAPLLPQQQQQPTITIQTSSHSGHIWSFFSVLLTVGAGGAAIFFLDKDGVEDSKTALSAGICGTALLNSLFRDLFPLFFSRTKEILLDKLKNHPKALVTAKEAHTFIQATSENARAQEANRSKELVVRKAQEFNAFLEKLNLAICPVLMACQILPSNQPKPKNTLLNPEEICLYMSNLGDRITGLTQSLETTEKELKERKEKFQNDWNRLRGQLVSAQEEFKTLQQSRNAEQELCTQISHLQTRIKELEGTNETLEGRLGEAQEQLEKIQQGNSQENEQLRIQITQLETEIHELKRINETHVTTKETLERDLTATKEEFEKVHQARSKEILDKQRCISELEKEMRTSRETAKKQLEAKGKEIEELKGKIGQANSATKEALALAAERKNTLSEWETIISKVNGALEKANAQALDFNTSPDSRVVPLLQLPLKPGPIWNLVAQVNAIFGILFQVDSSSAPSSVNNTPVKLKGVAFNLLDSPDPHNDSTDFFS